MIFYRQLYFRDQIGRELGAVSLIPIKDCQTHFLKNIEVWNINDKTTVQSRIIFIYCGKLGELPGPSYPNTNGMRNTTKTIPWLKIGSHYGILNWRMQTKEFLVLYMMWRPCIEIWNIFLDKRAKIEIGNENRFLTFH